MAVLRGAAPLDTTESMVLVVLASYADDTGRECWPSQTTIARQARLTDRSVRRVLTRLVGRGYVEVETAATGTRSARYRLRLDRIASPDTASGLGSGGTASTPDTASGLHDVGATSQTGHSVQLDRTFTPARPDTASADPSDSSEIRQSKPASPAGPERNDNTRQPPFRVYADIAKGALGESLLKDRSDDLGNVAELFKQRCSAQGLPYDGEITRKACEAAIYSRNKAAAKLLANRRVAS